jgi:hypothetical protein
MNVGTTLVADGEAAEAVKPGECAFHHPAMSAQPLAGVDPPASDAALDATPAQVGAAERRWPCRHGAFPACGAGGLWGGEWEELLPSATQ